MQKHDRALQELKEYTDKIGGGLQILYTSHNPTIKNGLPHPWQVLLGNHLERYHAYGVSMAHAILRCHKRWQDQKPGDDWEDAYVQPDKVNIKDWLDNVASRPVT